MAGNVQGISRRTLLGGSLAGAAGLALSACTPDQLAGSGSGSGADAGPIKFWDMVWGTGADYTKAAQTIASGYEPAAGRRSVTYQSIPWTNWYQTFTSAAASRTTPAVASGAAFLPFYFLEQGAVAPADNLVKQLDANGSNDFLPGLLDAMKTDKGYAAVPWSMDLRVLWVRTSLLEKAGAEIPTDFDSYVAAGTALQKAGLVGLGLAAGSTTTDAQHTVSALLINNGGGMFDADGNPDCVTDRNVEVLDFLSELVQKKIIDPSSASYTSDNLAKDWTSGRVAMGWGQTGLDQTFREADRDDLVVVDPLKGPHGDTGTVYYLNPLMMFSTTPSQESSEAFLAWYLDQIHTFWTSGVNTDLPVKKSISDLDVIQSRPNLVKSINDWQPIGKTIGAKAPSAFAGLSAVDGGAASAAFVQQIVAGKKSPKDILTDLQQGLEKALR